MLRVMIIRHAEKPHDRSRERGVDIDGVHAHHELTVRGWQRAGALVRFFAPAGGHADDAPISTPRTIFASAATPQSPSLRPQHTVRPLAEALGVAVDVRHASGEEGAMAAAALAAAQPVLISWRHSHIPALARALAGEQPAIPKVWPDDRFDLVWIFASDTAAGPWRFSQIPQGLFARDLAEGI